MRPYPAHLVKSLTLADGATIVIRPITPGDAAIEQEFVRNLSAESRYFRFMAALHELSPQMLSHFTNVDYDRHMALVAVTPCDARDTEIAVARYIVAPDNTSCEFALVVTDAWQRRGVGALLMDALMDAARRRGLTIMFGEVLASNHKMIDLMRRLGFNISHDVADPRLMRIEAGL
jgi:acetyltransferase